MKTSSIFNEVLGPVMVGPSSSHTAGPARIGMAVHNLLDGAPKKIGFYFDKDGSFAATYHAQGSDYGFMGGILGYDAGDEKIKESASIAESMGIDVSFNVTSFEAVHPNHVKIEIDYECGEKLKVEAISTGGGMFELIRYQGFPISFKGDSEIILLICSRYVINDIENILDGMGCSYDIGIEELNDKKLVFANCDMRLNEEALSAIKAMDWVEDFKYIPGILPVVKKKKPQMPFVSASEAEIYAEEHGLSLWEIACVYEEAISGETREKVLDKMKEIVRSMRYSAKQGLKSELPQRGFLPPKAKTMNDCLNSKEVKVIEMGSLNRITAVAAGVMEYDICRGKTVAAPTGGSCGVLPATVVFIGDEMGLSDYEIAKSMMVAGLVGVFIDHKATFAAEICGCQAEIGSGSSMAAAGLVNMMGGTVKQGFMAAALAMENLMGLICDPVAGVGNVPCVSRNPMGAVNAIISCNMVLCGFDPYIPLDEVMEAMMETGRLMPREHRCTSIGGLCASKTARSTIFK